MINRIGRWALGLFTGAAALSTAALAADMPVKAPPRTAAAVIFNWTSFYVGIQGGYGWGNSKHCDAGSVPQCGPLGTFIFPDFRLSGGTAGGTVGYNHQIGNIILGLEADYSWANIKGTSTLEFCGGICVTEVTGFGTARARIGYAIDRFLPYVTGGVAWTRMRASNGGAPQFPVTASATTRANLTVGGGVEFALSANWSSKIEYLFVRNNRDFAYDVLNACGVPNCFTRDNDYSVIRAGLNYRFGGPVVARY
jgi:outer membrane immunogenic protein